MGERFGQPLIDVFRRIDRTEAIGRADGGPGVLEQGSGNRKRPFGEAG